MQKKKNDEALELFTRALHLKEKTSSTDSLDLLPTLNNMADVERELKHVDEAEVLYKRMIGICEKNNGLDHPSVALPLNDLAATYMTEKKFAQAEPLLRRVVKIEEKDHGLEKSNASAEDLALGFDNLGTMYVDEEKYALAQQGPQGKNVQTSLNNLALLCREKGDTSETGKLFKEVVDLKAKDAGIDQLLQSSRRASRFAEFNHLPISIIDSLTSNTLRQVRGCS